MPSHKAWLDLFMLQLLNTHACSSYQFWSSGAALGIQDREVSLSGQCKTHACAQQQSKTRLQLLQQPVLQHIPLPVLLHSEVYFQDVLDGSIIHCFEGIFYFMSGLWQFLIIAFHLCLSKLESFVILFLLFRYTQQTMQHYFGFLLKRSTGKNKEGGKIGRSSHHVEQFRRNTRWSQPTYSTMHHASFCFVSLEGLIPSTQGFIWLSAALCWLLGSQCS